MPVFTIIASLQILNMFMIIYGDNMKNDNELILHIYSTCDMGIKSMTKLLTILKKKDNKIKKEISSELKEYESILISCKKIMDKAKIKKIGSNIIASIMANTTMTFEIDNDNSDAKIADILLRGYTMGILEMEKKIDDYKGNASKNILRLAKKLLSFQKESTEILKSYL